MMIGIKRERERKSVPLCLCVCVEHTRKEREAKKRRLCGVIVNQPTLVGVRKRVLIYRLVCDL